MPDPGDDVRRTSQALDDVDLDDWAAAVDAGERARAERRAARSTMRRPQARGAHAPLLGTTWGRVLAGAVAVLLAATLVGLVALWPGAAKGTGPSAAMGGATTGAKVTAVLDVPCAGPTPQRCRQLRVRVDGGAAATLTIGPVELSPAFARGDAIRVQKTGAAPGGRDAEPYAFASVDRRGTLLWLTVLFAVIVVALARRRGLLALIGFAGSLALVVKFLVPAILAGSPALLVALVGSMAVMFITVGLTYGVTAQSAAAVIGIAASLLLAALLGTLAAASAHLDGRSGEFSTALAQTAGGISLQGVVLAGLVLSALGVLADMAVTQASAVMALRRSAPRLGVRGLYREAFAVGRDHLVATTHTLVLAYVGATLPLLLVLQAGRVGFVDALNAQDIAEPVVATLVGAIALLVSVPLTTFLAAAVVARIPPAALPDAGHGHGHAH